MEPFKIDLTAFNESEIKRLQTIRNKVNRVANKVLKCKSLDAIDKMCHELYNITLAPNVIEYQRLERHYLKHIIDKYFVVEGDYWHIRGYDKTNGTLEVEIISVDDSAYSDNDSNTKSFGIKQQINSNWYNLSWFHGYVQDDKVFELDKDQFRKLHVFLKCSTKRKLSLITKEIKILD